MDIQELIESRIAELKARSTPPPPAGTFSGNRAQPAPGQRRAERETGEEGSWERKRDADMEPGSPPAEPPGSRNDFSGSVDSKLTEVLTRVMEITERVSIDCSRMEQDLLRSRLEVLQSAEAVLDITLSLRRQFMETREREAAEPRPAGGSSPSGLDMGMSRDDDAGIMGTGAGRASMKDHGVADLFRRT